MIIGVGVLLWLCGGVLGSVSNSVTVDGLGEVIGIVDYTSWTNRKIYSFRNVPYAEAPVGDMRFRPPVKITTWNGTLNATAAGKKCPQTKSISPNDTSGDFDEDCLSLNVFVPEVEKAVTALPVMIFIHGGSFIMNHADKYKPNYLLEEDIILVVPQFRLGIFGLLSLQTDEVPGNVMFLDQIMAMQWVQDNIEYFGGDKDRVTVFGLSSGSASINLHLLSPLSQGLFHRAIMASGSALGAWVVDYDPVSSATEFATLLGCNTTSTSAITSCMKNLTVQDILVTFNQYYNGKFFSGGLGEIKGCKAVIQKAGDFKFLTDDPLKMIKSGNFTKVPLIGGVVKEEGSFLLKSLYDHLLKPRGLWNDSDYLTHDFTPLLTSFAGINDATNGIEHILRTTYFPNNELGNFSKMLPGMTDIVSIFMIKAGVCTMLGSNSIYQNTYMYTFNYKGSYSVLPVHGSTYPSDGGVGHGDDHIYIFPHGNTFTKRDLVIARRMVQLWTSFAKTGVPSAEDVESWPAMTQQFGPYLIINDSTTIGNNFLYEYNAATHDANNHRTCNNI